MAEAQKKMRVIRVASTLIGEMVALVVAYPDARKTLEDFFRWRTEPGPVAPFGAKDSPLKGKYLGGVWHAHLVYGQELLIYRIFKESVHCYCIVDHTFVVSQPKQKSLSKIINKLEAGGLLPFDPAAHLPAQNDAPVEVNAPAILAGLPAPLAADEVSAVTDLLYEFGAHPQDRVVVKKAAAGDFEDLKTYLGCVLDRDMESSAEWELVTAAFGGGVSVPGSARSHLGGTRPAGLVIWAVPVCSRRDQGRTRQRGNRAWRAKIGTAPFGNTGVVSRARPPFVSAVPFLVAVLLGTPAHAASQGSLEELCSQSVGPEENWRPIVEEQLRLNPAARAEADANGYTTDQLVQITIGYAVGECVARLQRDPASAEVLRSYADHPELSSPAWNAWRLACAPESNVAACTKREVSAYASLRSGQDADPTKVRVIGSCYLALRNHTTNAEVKACVDTVTAVHPSLQSVAGCVTAGGYHDKTSGLVAGRAISGCTSQFRGDGPSRGKTEVAERSPAVSAGTEAIDPDAVTGKVLPFKIVAAIRNDGFRDNMVQALVTVSVTGGTPADWAATAIHVAEHAIVEDVTFAQAEVIIENPWGDRPPQHWKMLARADFSPIPGKSPWSDRWAVFVASRAATPAEIEYDELDNALLGKYLDTVHDPSKRLGRAETEARRFVIRQYHLPANWKPDPQFQLGMPSSSKRSHFQVVADEDAAGSMDSVGRCLSDETRLGPWRGCFRPTNDSYPDPLAMMADYKGR